MRDTLEQNLKTFFPLFIIVILFCINFLGLWVFSCRTQEVQAAIQRIEQVLEGLSQDANAAERRRRELFTNATERFVRDVIANAREQFVREQSAIASAREQFASARGQFVREQSVSVQPTETEGCLDILRDPIVMS